MPMWPTPKQFAGSGRLFHADRTGDGGMSRRRRNLSAGENVVGFKPLRAMTEANPLGKATLSKVLEDVRTLTPDELGKLRGEIDVLLAAPKPRSVEEEVERLLFERGVVSEIKPRALDPARYRDRKPVEVKGKPISEVIIEERR
jgi:hypothetical protein